jgi:predicted secreted protein
MSNCKRVFFAGRIAVSLVGRVKLIQVVLLVAVVAAASFAGEPSPNANSQLPAGAMQQKAAEVCSTCHEARIIVQQRLGKPAWAKEIDKMIKWGAEVDPKDRDALIDYFAANFNPDQTAYAAPRTFVGSKSKTKGH